MAEKITEFLTGKVGLGTTEISIIVLVVAIASIYVDRNEYANWSELPPGHKIFNASKIFALICILIGIVASL